MFLWKLTGARRFGEDMRSSGERYAALVKAKTYLEPGYRNLGEHAGVSMGVALNMDFFWTACLFLENFPDDPLAGDMKSCLKSMAGEFARLSSVEPWGQAMNLSKPGETPARYPSERPLNYWTMMAYGLAKGAVLCKDKEMLRLAERQVQWCLGMNPYDLSMVAGVGSFASLGDFYYREPEYYAALMEGRNKWHFDGDVGTGGSFRKGGASDPSGYTPMFADVGRPWEPGANIGPSEFWQVHAGAFAAAAAALAQACEAQGSWK
jgi:hypothetical protein